MLHLDLLNRLKKNQNRKFSDSDFTVNIYDSASTSFNSVITPVSSIVIFGEIFCK